MLTLSTRCGTMRPSSTGFGAVSQLAGPGWPPRAQKSGADAAGDVLAERLGAGPDHVRVEARRQGGQGGVQVKGQVGVGAGGPAVVGRAAGGQGGAADGERVERVGGLARADGGEIADGPLPRVVVQGGAGL